MPASISSVSTADGYGLIVYLAGPSNGLIVFRKMHHSWRVISSGGLSLNYRALLGVGVPESIARRWLQPLRSQMAEGVDDLGEPFSYSV